MNAPLRRVYHHYEQWEDWKHGMYRLDPIDGGIVESARQLLADKEICYAAMVRVILEWPMSCEVNLSNRSRNRQAYLGQAACCLVCNASEDMTKVAWHKLNQAEKDRANAVADMVIARWERSVRYKGQMELPIFAGG